MSAGAFIVAAALLRILDPFTSVYQTDDPREGAALASESGYWPVPQGLADPLAAKLQPRIVHASFRISETPLLDYDPGKPSPLFKVNQVGYLPCAPKFAYAGAWLGPAFGPWKPHAPMDSFELVRVGPDGSETTVLAGKPLLRVKDETTKEGVPFTGEETYEMDFSSVTNSGTYFVRIPGVGRSAEFRIAADAAEEAFRVHMLGLYQKRCGIAKSEPYTHWTSGACHTDVVRGTFPPEEGKLEPKVRWFAIIRHNTDWDNGERLHLAGGWHDAADYDRRPQHLNLVNDLCAVYLMRPDNFRDGQLSIPENANGIPDILDEAEWGLRHLLAGQRKDGGVGTWVESFGHPEPGNVAAQDDMPYALSMPTRRSSLMYDAHAALLSRCHPAFREKYLDSAIRAFDYAMQASPQKKTYTVKHKRGRIFKRTVTEHVSWTEDRDFPAAYLVKAALNLFALTGDARFTAQAEKEMPRLLDEVKTRAWNWPPLLFAGERALDAPPVDFKEFLSRWERRTMNVANEILGQMAGAYAYRAPWWAPQKGWVNSMAWGNSHPLRRAQYLVAAHGITGDDKYLEAASLANDFHNGCNPQGTTLTSGLGKVYPVAFLDIPSYVDGIVEFVPGITPYRWNYGMPAKAVEMVFGGDKAMASKWPIWRRWGNLENQTVAASEYTVWETIAPAASVTGYLIDPKAATPPRPLPQPAKRLQDLPGYWVLP